MAKEVKHNRKSALVYFENAEVWDQCVNTVVGKIVLDSLDKETESIWGEAILGVIHFKNMLVSKVKKDKSIAYRFPIDIRMEENPNLNSALNKQVNRLEQSIATLIDLAARQLQDIMTMRMNKGENGYFDPAVEIIHQLERITEQYETEAPIK